MPLDLALDLLLLLGATLRLTRLVTTDDLGWWLIRGPAYRATTRPLNTLPAYLTEPEPDTTTLAGKLASGLGCPHCVGFWIGLALLTVWSLTGGIGHGWEDLHGTWRFVTGALTLSYLVGHIGARLDGDDE